MPQVEAGNIERPINIVINKVAAPPSLSLYLYPPLSIYLSISLLSILSSSFSSPYSSSPPPPSLAPRIDVREELLSARLSRMREKNAAAVLGATKLDILRRISSGFLRTRRKIGDGK
jgi:hypothetical protein